MAPSNEVPILWMGQGLPKQDTAKPESSQSCLGGARALVWPAINNP